MDNLNTVTEKGEIRFKSRSEAGNKVEEKKKQKMKEEESQSH